MNDLLQFLSFSDPNVRFVTIGTMILGATAAMVGSFSFLRKKALVGDAIAHSILPGVCLAFMLSGSKDPLVLIVGAFITGWLSLIIIDGISRTTKLKNDAAIGIVLSVFFGFGILLLTSIQQSGNAAQSGLDKFLFGKAASLTQYDILVFSSIGIVLILVLLLFYKEFKLISFNPDYAKVIGLPVKFLEFILATITVLAVAVGIQAVGVVLMAALLITPASGARFWTHRLGTMIFIAMVFGAISGFFGSFISYVAPSMPTGPWVVMCLSFLTIGSIWFAPKRGMLAKYRVQHQNQQKILKENVLKLFYHIGEKENDFHAERSIEQLLKTRDLRPTELKKGLHLLKSENTVRNKDDKWLITAKGLNEAIRIIRLHRLWEMYLNQRLKLEPDHVHNDAEAIEHIITPEIERQLEKELNYPTKDPHQSIIPYIKE
ncbi:MAG: zinc ABC transporter permease [Bacteroidetes bacterium]|nr:MAG: zinc ABC transporter permease [Bacteroidota bacterium]MBL1145277.1 zinc ABC transporter permease [Bacteroidota bacterium]NOG58073.1 iron chelate uptake ABC transporter family permease subunit [Bacteroidota bacterium]